MFVTKQFWAKITNILQNIFLCVQR